ncbi:hypothetical protein U2F26_30075 [Micromonospora sp. 4G57]|uniref:Uncharacterized protein n=1 Tax=Micromonospora sicca TaxID=2202420 RepID=A0ABU5JLZ0_9ACTN|nr:MULTISPECIES: hypothetical protein [unclassified Micromonospora]MDZ5446923.1 hypothetical protein [Micromonospora sp. 4G57]MDZ5493601.1 hypothetical protein [Micromonospora sp. 4G53]
MLLRLAYLGMTNAFAVLRLLPMSDWDKDVEILALRHQITVLERQLGKDKVRFDAQVRLADVADVRVVAKPEVITHDQVSRSMDVVANVRGRGLGTVTSEVTDRLAQVTFPVSTIWKCSERPRRRQRPTSASGPS